MTVWPVPYAIAWAPATCQRHLPHRHAYLGQRHARYDSRITVSHESAFVTLQGQSDNQHLTVGRALHLVLELEY